MMPAGATDPGEEEEEKAAVRRGMAGEQGTS